MKRTWQPKKLKRKRKHGFLESSRERASIIAARRKKGRWKLTV